MKRLVTLILFVGALAASLSAQAVITRFAVVDMDRIISAFTSAEAEGCSVVIARDEGVVWCSPAVDVTAKVIRRLSGGR